MLKILFSRFVPNYYFLSRICFLITLMGCEQTFLIEMDVEYEKKIHSTGYIINGQSISLYVQLTQHPLHPQPDEELELDIILKTQKGESIELRTDGLNFYQTTEDFTPQTGQCFRLQVDYSPLESVNNIKMVCVPAPVLIDSLSYSVDAQRNGLFHFYFTDPPGPNFYAIRLLKFDEEGNEIQEAKHRILPETSFSDQVAINGQITAFTSSSIIWHDDEGPRFVHAVKAILYHLDEHTFQFLQSIEEAEGTLDDLWSEPTMVYSNMSNEVGIFGAFATDTMYMELNLKTTNN